MLDSEGFNQWAGGYDTSVQQTETREGYPFAGYTAILDEIYRRVVCSRSQRVLDIGLGTGTLTERLYQQGCTLYGQDFSQAMIEIARQKMPQAHLYLGDFSKGLVDELKRQKYDAIVATYSLHHLPEEEQFAFVREEALPLLSERGRLYIGDVLFPTRAELEHCRNQVGLDWDETEHYFVVEEWKRRFPRLDFQLLSFCSGILMLQNE